MRPYDRGAVAGGASDGAVRHGRPYRPPLQRMQPLKCAAHGTRRADVGIGPYEGALGAGGKWIGFPGAMLCNSCVTKPAKPLQFFGASDMIRVQ